MNNKVFQHVEPIWPEKSNFLIGVSVSPTKAEPSSSAWEQLWSNRLSDYKFELTCIPMFAYGISLGDIVETDSNFMITRVVMHSGHKTYRVWFMKEESSFQKQIFDSLANFGCLLERYSSKLIGVDTPTADIGLLVKSYLSKIEQDGDIYFEIGNE